MATSNKTATTTAVENQTTTREANGKRKTKVGALWKRTGQSGNIYFTGEISNGNDDPLGAKTQVVGFVRRAADKKDRDGNPKNYPDIELYLSDRAVAATSKDTSKPSNSAASTDDDDSQI